MFYQRKWWHAWNLADLIVSCVLNLYAFNIFLLFSSSSIIKFSPKIINLVDVLCHIMIFKRALCCYSYSVTDETQITNFLVSGMSKQNSFLAFISFLKLFLDQQHHQNRKNHASKLKLPFIFLSQIFSSNK